MISLVTPFRGTGVSSLGLAIANCASFMGLDSDRQPLRTLEEDFDRLNILLNNFGVIAKELSMRLVCFYKVQATRKNKFGIGFNVVVRDLDAFALLLTC